MAMQFRTIKTALVTILGNEAAGRYNVLGYQKQSTDALTVEGQNRQVTVYYKSGSYPRSAASQRGPVRHEMDFQIELLVSSNASGDVSALENPASTEAEKAAAIAAFTPAAERCDLAMDELIDIIYQTLMDNEFVRLDDGANGDLKVSNRWITRVQKDDVMPNGGLAILTASLNYQVIAMELLAGKDSVGALTSVLVDLQVPGEENTAKAQVEAGGTT